MRCPGTVLALAMTLATAPAGLDLAPFPPPSYPESPLTSEQAAHALRTADKELQFIGSELCLPGRELPASLTAKYGEEVAWRGQFLGQNELWLMLAPDRQSWSLVALPVGEGQACSVVAGRAWQLDRVLWQREGDH